MTAKNRNSMEGGVMRRAEGLGKHENAMELLRNFKKNSNNRKRMET